MVQISRMVVNSKQKVKDKKKARESHMSRELYYNEQFQSRDPGCREVGKEGLPGAHGESFQVKPTPKEIPNSKENKYRCHHT